MTSLTIHRIKVVAGVVVLALIGWAIGAQLLATGPVHDFSVAYEADFGEEVLDPAHWTMSGPTGSIALDDGDLELRPVRGAGTARASVTSPPESQLRGFSFETAKADKREKHEISGVSIGIRQADGRLTGFDLETQFDEVKGLTYSCTSPCTHRPHLERSTALGARSSRSSTRYTIGVLHIGNDAVFFREETELARVPIGASPMEAVEIEVGPSATSYRLPITELTLYT